MGVFDESSVCHRPLRRLLGSGIDLWLSHIAQGVALRLWVGGQVGAVYQ